MSKSRALVAGITELGDLQIGWISGPQGSLNQKRLSVYVDWDDPVAGTGLQVYAVRTGPGNVSELVYLKTREDMEKVWKEYSNA